MILSALITLPFFGGWVLAQEAVCSDSSFSWSFNSLDQSPCEIGSSLSISCKAGAYIGVIPSDEVYVLTEQEANACLCNTVFYTLLSVCALCQGDAGVEPYNLWIFNCSSSEIMPDNTYTLAIPSGVAIPHYAFDPLDPTSDLINTNELQNDKGPEVNGSSGTKKKTPIGAIVGGVVGGVVFIGAVVGAVLLFKRVRFRKAQSTEPIMAEHHPDPKVPATFSQGAGQSPFSPVPSVVPSPPFSPVPSVVPSPPFSPVPSAVPSSQYSSSTSPEQMSQPGLLLGTPNPLTLNAQPYPISGSPPSPGASVPPQQYGVPHQAYLPQF